MLEGAMKDKIYDRMTADLPINSVVAPTVVKDGAGDYIKVLQSLRDDTLAYMLSHKQIDAAQFEAGREWQAHYENAQIGGISAIDPFKEAVDGGKPREPITDQQIRAFKALGNARKTLGHHGHDLIVEILGSRQSLTEAAIRRGLGSKDGRAYVGRRFRECLESLAKLWGFA